MSKTKKITEKATNGRKSSRLEARITADQKELIERAAAYQGRTVSDFVIQTVQEAAQSVIQDHEVIRLNREQSSAFVDLLLHPPPPNKRLRNAAKRHRKNVTMR